MAYIRFSAMRVSSSVWLRTQRVLVASIAIAGTVFFLCMPTLLAHQISAHRSIGEYSLRTTDETISEEGQVVVRYSINFSDMVMSDSCFFMKANLWLTGIGLKVNHLVCILNKCCLQVVPCILLFWFTVALIGKLRQNRKKRKQLLKEDKQRRRSDVTTVM